MKVLNLIILLITLAGIFSATGCATTEPENISERPWNAPKNWETGLPAGMMNPRY
jgi:hypothetical protein